jgi:hypothetical protein
VTRAASPRCLRCDAHLRRRSSGSARGSVAVSVTPRPSLCSISDAEFTKASCTRELLRPPETQCLRSSEFPGTPLDTLNPVGLTLSSRRERRPWPPSAVDKFFAAPEFAMNPPETFLSLTNAGANAVQKANNLCQETWPPPANQLSVFLKTEPAACYTQNIVANDQCYSCYWHSWRRVRLSSRLHQAQ